MEEPFDQALSRKLDALQIAQEEWRETVERLRILRAGKEQATPATESAVAA